MPRRISRTPSDIAEQCRQAAVGIGNEPQWPAANAPTAAQMHAASDDLLNKAGQIANAAGALRVMRREFRDAAQKARLMLGKVDNATDMLYGPGGAAKANFGLHPKKKTRTARGVPERVVIARIGDGTAPASLFVDWSAVEGAVYEVQWFADAPLTQMVGSQTVTKSELEIADLTRGNQYWVRVRAVRAGKTGPWSDEATRVANI